MGSRRLDRLTELVRWYRFDKLLGRLRDDGPGRAAWPPLSMFKALLLASLYGLSDAELEEALKDRRLEQAGMVLERGTMLDGTLIETGAASRPRENRPPVDPEAGFSKRSGKPGSAYGYKADVGVDIPKNPHGPPQRPLPTPIGAQPELRNSPARGREKHRELPYFGLLISIPAEVSRQAATKAPPARSMAV